MVLDWLRGAVTGAFSNVQGFFTDLAQRFQPLPTTQTPTSGTPTTPAPASTQVLESGTDKASKNGKNAVVIVGKPDINIPSIPTNPFKDIPKEKLEQYVKEKPDLQQLNKEIEKYNKEVEAYKKIYENEYSVVKSNLEAYEKKLAEAEAKAKATGDYSEYEKVYSEYKKYYDEVYLPLHNKLAPEYERLTKTGEELQKKVDAYKLGERAEVELARFEKPEEPPYYSPTARQAGRPFPIPGMLGDIFDIFGKAFGIEPKEEEIKRVAEYEKEFAEVNPIYGSLLGAQKFFEEKFVKEPIERFESEGFIGKIALAPAVAGGIFVGGMGMWGAEGLKMFTATPTGLGKSLGEAIQGRPEEARRTYEKSQELMYRSGAEFVTDLAVGFGIGKALSKGFTAVAPYAMLPLEKGYKVVKPVVEPIVERVKPPIAKVGTTVKESVKEAVEFKPRELEIKMTEPEPISTKLGFEEGFGLMKERIRTTLGVESPEESLIKNVGIFESDTIKPKVSYTSEELEIFRKGSALDGKKVDTLTGLKKVSEKEPLEVVTTPIREYRMSYSPIQKEPSLAFKITGTEGTGFELSLFSRTGVKGIKGIKSRETLVKWYETTGLVAKEPKELDITAKVIAYRKLTPFFKKETTLGITMKPGLGRVVGLEGRRGAMIELRTPEVWHSTGFLAPLEKKGWIVFDKRLIESPKIKKGIKKSPSKPLKLSDLAEDISKPPTTAQPIFKPPEKITSVKEGKAKVKPVIDLEPKTGLYTHPRARTKVVLQEEYIQFPPETPMRYIYPDISKSIPELLPRGTSQKLKPKIATIGRARTEASKMISDVRESIKEITGVKSELRLREVVSPFEKPKVAIFEVPRVSEKVGIGEMPKISEMQIVPPIPDITPPPPPQIVTPATISPWKMKLPGRFKPPVLPVPGVGFGDSRKKGRWKAQWYRREWELFQKLLL